MKLLFKSNACLLLLVSLSATSALAKEINFDTCFDQADFEMLNKASEVCASEISSYVKTLPKSKIGLEGKLVHICTNDPTLTIPADLGHILVYENGVGSDALWQACIQKHLNKN